MRHYFRGSQSWPILCFLLLSVLCFSLVAGCKSAPDASAPDGDKPTEEVPENNADDKAPDAEEDEPEAAENPDLKTYPDLAKIELPEGFQIRMFAPDIPGARSLQRAPGGTIFVGSRKQGKVYALVGEDEDGHAAEVKTIAEGLNSPNGVAFYDGALYVAEIDKIWRYPDIEDNLDEVPEPELISDAFPSDEHHGWKFIKFGPDDKLYVPVGAPCNICEPDPDEYANLQRMNPDGSELEVFARGVRNTVGFAWHPESEELWFTDNGRDMMGDDLPPDELNHAPEKELNFGYPYCHGDDVEDPEFGDKRGCDEFVKPSQNLVAHAAALGMRFYTGEAFPSAYKNQIFIAEHGSWNRSEKVGYRVTLVELDADHKPKTYEPFAQGWLQGEEAWGRPVDIEWMEDGSMLVSDDHAGAIYRIIYQP